MLERDTPSLEALDATRCLDFDNAEALSVGERWAQRARFGLNRSRAFEPAWRGYLDAIRAFPHHGLAWLRAGIRWRRPRSAAHRAPLSDADMGLVLDRLAAIERRWIARDGELDPWRYYRRALELDPNNPYFHDIAAIHFLRRGDKVTAGRHVERAVALLPDLGYHQPLQPYFGDVASGTGPARLAIRPAVDARSRRHPSDAGIGARREPAGRGKRPPGERERRGAANEPRRTALAAGVAMSRDRDVEAVALWLAYGDSQEWSAGAARQAYAFFNQPGRAAARERFLAAIAARTGAHPRAALLAAQAAEADGDVAGAARVLELYRRRFPDDADALNRLYQLYNRSGDRVRAEETLRRVIRLRPEEPGLYLELGRVLVAQDLVEQAWCPSWRWRCGSFPTTPRCSSIWRSSTSGRAGTRWLRARSTRRWPASRPSDWALQLRVCRSYLLAGDRDKARQCYTAVMKADPGNETVRRELDALR